MPAELRNKIYKLVLQDSVLELRYPYYSSSSSRFFWRFLTVSRQVRDEAESLLYALTLFSSPSPRVLQNFLRTRKHSQLEAIQIVKLWLSPHDIQISGENDLGHHIENLRQIIRGNEYGTIAGLTGLKVVDIFLYDYDDLIRSTKTKQHSKGMVKFCKMLYSGKPTLKITAHIIWGELTEAVEIPEAELE